MLTRPNGKFWLGRGRRWLIGLVVVGALSGLAAGFYFSLGGEVSADQPAIPRGASLAAWSENGAGGRHLLQLAETDVLPAAWSAFGIVLSDTNCAPDSEGFSHCHNDIELASGNRLTVIDTHDMRRNPCLEPGQRLSLKKIAPYWLEAVAS